MRTAMSDVLPFGPDIVETLLGVPAGTPSWQVARAADKARALALWLSAAQCRGDRLGGAEQLYLDRVRRRSAALHAVGADMAAAHGVRILKGPLIARHYPEGLLRPSGDADLVAADQPALWSAALDLEARFAAQPQSISFMGGPAGPVHVVVALKWPAEEPHLDKPMGADIADCAYCGDFRGVPLRPEPPQDDDVASLFAIAEERFQRKFRLRDLLDFLVLAHVLERALGDALGDTVCHHAERLALAPELRALAGKAAEWVEPSVRWAGTAADLAPLAAAEKARRVSNRSGAPRLRFGLPLGGPRATGPDVEFVEHDGLQLAVTPLGTCLLVGDPVIAEETWSRAVCAVRDLESIHS